MRPPGTPAELERRRRLAVRRLQAGYSVAQVAAFLEVDPSSVRRWRGAFQRQGKRALRARRGAGRPPKLSATQAKIVRRWLRAPASEQGFATELWTGARLAWLLEAEFGVRLTPARLSVWLRARGLTPQKPARVPRERDPQAIARWLEADRPRIKKGPPPGSVPGAHRRERPLDGAALGPPRAKRPCSASRERTARRSRCARRCGFRPTGSGWASSTKAWSTATSTTGAWPPSWKRCWPSSRGSAWSCSGTAARCTRARPSAPCSPSTPTA